MYIISFILFILMLYCLINDNSPFIFEKILKVEVKLKPFISLKEMNNQLKISENPEHINELKRLIRNRRIFWFYFILFIFNFMVISYLSR